MYFKHIRNARLIRRMQISAFFTIALMLILSMGSPIVYGQKSSQDVTLDMAWADEHVKPVDSEEDYFDLKQLTTGIEQMSFDFLSAKVEPVKGVYYGAFLNEYLAHDYLNHKFINTYEETYVVNAIRMESKFRFSRNMIMSGSSEFWLRLPVTPESILGYASSDGAMGIEPIGWLFMYQDSNEDGTFFSRPIVLDPKDDRYSSGVGGQLISNRKIYVKCRYPIVPDKTYTFELYFWPSERVEFYLTEEITSLSHPLETIEWTQWSPARNPVPSVPPEVGYEPDRMRSFFDIFFDNGDLGEKVVDEEFQLSWIFTFTQGMDETGLTGIRHQFKENDVLIINPQIEELNAGSDEMKRVNLFVPWINHENREFGVDLRLETHSRVDAGDVLLDYGEWCNADNDVDCDAGAGEIKRFYWDTRTDMNGDNVVDYDLTPQNRDDFIYSDWQLIDVPTEAENTENEYEIYRSTGGPVYNDVDIQIGMGAEAVAYFSTFTASGVRVRGVDTTNIYKYTQGIKKRDIGNAYKENIEDNWVEYLIPVYGTAKVGAQLFGMNDAVSDLSDDPGTQASLTLFVETVGGRVYRLPDDFPELSSNSTGFLYESPERTGSQNTFRFTAQAHGIPRLNIQRVWAENVVGPIIYRVGKNYVNRTTGVPAGFYAETDSDGISVKDFLLLTTNIYTRAWVSDTPKIEGGWRLYIIFREDIELTFLANIRDQTRYYARSWNVHNAQDGVDYHARNQMSPELAGVGHGIYSAIMHNLGSTDSIFDDPPGTFEPIGFEIYSVMEFTRDNDIVWGFITGTTINEYLDLGRGSRSYDVLLPFASVAFVGFYAMDIRLPDGTIVPEVTILDSNYFGSKWDFEKWVKKALADLFELGGEIYSLIQEGFNFLAELIIEIIPNAIVDAIEWLAREITKFFTNLFSVVLDIIGMIGFLMELAIVLFIIGAFVFVILLINRKLNYISKNVSGGKA